MLKNHRVLSFVAILFTLLVISASAYSQRFGASIDGAQETPPSGSAGVGYGNVVVSPDGTQITVNMGFTGLGTTAIAAHIHTGPVGVAGPVTFGLAGVPAATGGVIPQQTFAISPAQLADLLAGNMYFNIHTGGFPGGEIRGQILPPSCTTASAIEVHASAGTMGPTGYATLALAATAINTGVHQGSIDVEVCADTTEAAVVAAPSVVLNASGGTSSYTGINVFPVGGAARTISGPATAGFALIDLNGADNLVIDGLNTGGNSLTISNTTVSATSITSTIRFIGGATNNTITNSNIQGSGTMSVATNGAVIFFSTDAVTANGNDNNTISNNNIGPAGANLPTKGILCNGSTGALTGNNGLIINNNNIFDYYGAAVTSAGVAVNGGCANFSITNNRFYQTATRTQTTAALHSAINMNSSTATSGVQGMTITGNIIGYASNTQTGTYALTGAVASTFRGISFTGITGGTVSNINNNTVASVSMTGVTSSGTSSSAPFMGIYVSNGTTNVNTNTIGSQAATGSLNYSTTSASAADVNGIFNFGVDNWTTTGNNIGGITAANAGAGAANVYGLRVNTGSGVTWTCTGNTIGGTIANSLQSTSTATGAIVQGVLNSNPIGTITGNTIRNLTNAGGTGTTTSASVAGIVITSSANQTIGQNTIFNLNNTNATAASVVTGIQFTGSTANVVERNFIYSLTSATNSATAEINGIRVAGGTTIYRNNMIAIGAGVANAIGATPTNSGTTGINGINEFLGINSFFHNSVYIGGAPTALTGASYAFNGTQTISTRSFRDNVFYNARTNAGTAAGSNFAVKINGTAPNPTGLTINNNVYFANGIGAVFGFFNSLPVANIAAWKVAVGQDAGSFESNPQYLDPTNAVPDLHIHPTNATVIEGNGSDVGVTNDFDGQTRASLTPVDIGADAGNFSGVDLSAPSISYTALLNTSSTANRVLSVTITDVTGVATGGLAPRIYFNKNAGAYFSTACSLAGGTVNNGTWNCTIDNSLIGGVVATDIVRYFVVAQDTLGNLAANPSGGFTGTDVNTVGTPPTTPNQYTIVGSATGTYLVGTGQTYTSLTNAGGIFEFINNSEVTGDVDIELTSDLTGELGTVTLNEFAAGFNVRIFTCSAPRSITGSNTGALIRLNGADNVTIDGNPNTCGGANVGGRPALRGLTIQNTSTSTAAWVISVASNATNGAQNNSILNLNLMGQDPTTTAGIISIGGATPRTVATGPNLNNRVENCSLKRAISGIYSAGQSAASPSTGTYIAENETSAVAADRIRRVGILLLNDNGAFILENSLNGISTNESADGIGIGVGTESVDTTSVTSGGVINAFVQQNKINGVASLSTTGFSAAGITVAGASGGPNTIRNNMITGVTAPATSPDIVAGIYVVGAAGSSTRLYHNSIAMTGDRGTVNAQMPSYGVAITGTDPTVELKNNIIYTTQTAGCATACPTALSYAVGMVTTTFVNLDSNYNDFWSGGVQDGGFRSGSLALSAGTSYVDLLAWQAATADDANAFEIDPFFINPASDLHLNAVSSPMLGVGLTGFATVDHDADPRPGVGNPDIGADELVQSTGGVIPAGTFYNASTAPNDQLGGSVTITNSITLGGILTTGNFNTLTLECNATFANAGGGNYVVGTVNKQYCGTGAFTYPVGTPVDNLRPGSPAGSTNFEYTPVTVNVTAGTFPSYLSARVFDATLVGFDPANSLSRNWQLEELGDITADLSFTYLPGIVPPGDVNGTETDYRVWRRNANGTSQDMCGAPCVNTGTSTIGPATGVTQFSRWTGSGPLAPTAAGVTVSGRILTPSGAGLRNARVMMTDTRGVTRTAITGGFGYYTFDDVRAGETYVISVGSKRFVFTPRTVQVLDELTDVDLTAEGER